MKKTETFENYPWWILVLSSMVTLGVYATGFLIMLKLHLLAGILFILYCLFLEIRLIKTHCIKCYYWGKRCGFGKGKISSLFFKKGDNTAFCTLNISWRTMIPDILVSLAPLVAGIVLLFLKFELYLLFCMLILVLLTTLGNGMVRGNLTCNHCIQRELGCPAEKLFDKNKTN